MQLVVSCVRDEVEAMAYTHTHTERERWYADRNGYIDTKSSLNGMKIQIRADEIK